MAGLRGVFQRRRASVASVSVVSAFSTALFGLAVMYPGTPIAQVDLNDGGVWVTNADQSLIGHLNVQAGELDSGLRATSNDFDVLQRAGAVVLADSGSRTASPVDVADVVLGAATDLPAGAMVAMGGDMLAILDSDGMRLWTMPAEQLASFDAEETPPTATWSGPAVMVVGQDGAIWAADAADATLQRVGPSGVLESHALEVGGEADLDVTTVGQHAVVLDRTAGTVSVDGGRSVTVAGAEHAVLQQPGPDDDVARLATADALVDVPLNGSAPTSQEAGGEGVPAAPVRLNGCTYAAWSGSGRYLRDCDGTSADVARDIPDVGDGELRFRVNRDVVVLNNLATGAVWLTDDALTMVNNWEDVTPPPDDSQNQDTPDISEDLTLPDRTQENRPPVAADDNLGVRPGRTTVLPVLSNDSDPDGDVLVAKAAGQPSFGALVPVRDDEAFQLAVPESATGSSTFTYTADDGRGGTDEAAVSLEVHPWSVNDAPVQDRIPTLIVEQGATATVNVLPTFSDPDGDTVFLQSASSTTDDGVTSTPDGRITFADVGTSAGRKTVTLTVSDGTESVDGQLQVEVRTAGNEAPVANADHASTVVGRAVTVLPLANDTDANGDVLRLAKVDERADLQAVMDPSAGTVTLTAAASGTYYLTYLVTDGPDQATGLIRLDVADATGEAGAPVAVQDVALLPSGGEVYVDPTANDVDPVGGLLVVQSVTLPAGSPLQVAVVEHHLLRVAASAALSGPTSFTYSVSNGTGSATGEVVVLPVPAPAQFKPPVAVDDAATVRVGDVVTIPVLDNDSSPSGDTLSLTHDLVQAPEAGAAFVSGATVRFEAPAQATTVHLIYQVTDSRGQAGSAQVTITVRAADLEHNSPPQPQATTARGLAGQSVRIPVTLDGVDPDGDSVTLVGIGSAPTKGRVVTVGESWLDYEASKDASGTDEFTYVVQDRLGARATGTVRVGLAPAATTNQNPVAVEDEVSARPGRDLAVAVLANDIDPDGDELSLVDGTLETAADVTPEVSGDRVALTTPGGAGTVTIYYGIEDGRSGTATGSLVVAVDPAAPALPPLANDDLVSAEVVNGATETTVDVLTNDEDPDGDAADLTVSCDVADVVVGADGTLTIPVTQLTRYVRYSVTDADGLIGQAFVRVPGSDDQVPRLRSTTPVEVASGAALALELKDLVVVASGRTPRVTTAASVSALHGNGAPVLVDEDSLTFTSADRYFGDASVTFEVTDGTGPDDPEGRTAVLTVPITVLPPENQPPTFTSQDIQIAPGEDGVPRDLTALTTDPDDGDLARMRYSVVGDPGSGISVRIDGQKLTATAGVDVAKGTTVTVKLSIDDGTTPTVEGTLTVTVVASTRPLATTVDDVLDDAHQGRTEQVSVLANDTSPFIGQQLTLVGSAAVESGTGTAAYDGQKVVVTPAKDFVGTMVVRYRVADATGDPDREVDGRVRLTVKGRPEAPGTPTVSEVRSKTVVLSWGAPTDNGSPITGYTVTASGGRTWACPATTCTLDGLTNNQEYTFTVVATNAVGTSDASPASATTRPDERPTAPGVPTLVFGDAQLSVTWAAPTGYEGSPVETSTLEISPAPPAGSTQVTGLTGNSYTWTGLENGVPYTVRVQAINRAPEPSDFSGWSATEIPAGVPDAPGQPTTTRLDPVGAQAQLRVDWVAPAANGDAIRGYTVHVLRGGSETRTVTATTPQAVITLDTSESDYTFTVDATNKAGTGAASAGSAARRAFVAPGAVTGLSAAEGDNAVALTYGAAPGNGAKAGEVAYQYQVNGGGWNAMPADKVIRSGVGNNGTYTLGVKAVTTMDGVTYDGPVSTSNAVAPYGVPFQPGAGATQNARSVTLSWSPPARNGRDFHLEIRIDTGGWENVGSGGGSRTVGDAYSETHRIWVRTVDVAGQVSSEAYSEATSGARPVYNYTVDDSFASGTCAQTSQTASWPLSSGTCNGTWVANGGTIGAVCWARGTTYAVTYANGTKVDWNLWLLDNTDKWIKGAAMSQIPDNNTPGSAPAC